VHSVLAKYSLLLSNISYLEHLLGVTRLCIPY
jgi:hypothetical protein